MPDLLPVTLDDMIREVQRECEMRRDVFGRAVRERRMNARLAARRIDVMDAVLEHLKGEQDGKQQLGERHEAP